MSDPNALSLATIGAVALTEGIKFLYGQAGDLLKRWHEHRKKSALEVTEQADQSEAVGISLPAAFEGQFSSNPIIHLSVIQEAEEELNRLHNDLSEYANGIKSADEANLNLLEKVDRLRQILENIYQQRITFKGERRPPFGSPVVVGQVEAKVIAGEVKGVEAKTAESGETIGAVKADRIEPGGRVTGVRLNTVGGKTLRKKSSRK